MNAYALGPRAVAFAVPPVGGEQQRILAKHVKKPGDEAKVALRNPVRLILIGGQAYDVSQARALIDDINTDHVIADMGYDSDAFVRAAESSGTALRPTKPYRPMAIRYEQTARNYIAFCQLAFIMVLSP